MVKKKFCSRLSTFLLKVIKYKISNFFQEMPTELRIVRRFLNFTLNLNHYFHLHVCPSMCSYVTLQRFIPLIDPDASTH